MICAHCGHEADGGKYCINCGSPLDGNKKEKPLEDLIVNVVGEEESAPSLEAQQSVIQDTTATNSQDQTKTETNKKDFSDKLANIFVNFGHFFMTLIKKPSMAKKANHNDIYSAIITIVAFSLFIALSTFLPVAFYSRSNWFMPGPSIFYGFIAPLVILSILFIGFASLTFAAIKISKMDLTYLGVIGKYGAYLLPYVLIYIAGSLLALGQMPLLPVIFLSIGVLGPIFAVPALILFEREGSGFDKIYTLLGLYFVELLLIILFSNSLFGRIINDLFYFLP
ncbi:hypothetical protein [Ornithinibacillus sp. 179-J 7C1 HS]|uniref:hypothetical protein n=1 Tax=Ornithinibacillus sp. 179-J 7C1 HS TaxID=3142384 RepID=UPI00399F9536